MTVGPHASPMKPGERSFEPIPEETEELSFRVLDAAYGVHTSLGPGMLEGIYQEALWLELEKRGIGCRREVPVSVSYLGEDLGVGLRMDLLVGESLVLEIKSVDELTSTHKAQLLTYLRAAGYRLGLLLNVGSPRRKEGIERVIL